MARIPKPDAEPLAQSPLAQSPLAPSQLAQSPLAQSESDYAQCNRVAWDRLARAGHPLTRPATDAEFVDPLGAVDGCGWLGPSVRGWRLLCLAAGGGRQGPLFAAAGAEVTVADASPAMLQLDRAVAAERGLSLRTIQTSMDDLSMLGAAQFDAVWHPVSSCYVSDVAAVYRQIARVTRPGGLYVSQHKQPASLQLAPSPSGEGYTLRIEYYRRGPLPPSSQRLVREPGTMEYLHTWQQLLGGLCRSGFVIEDLLEPVHAHPSAHPGQFGHRSRFVAPYVRIKARRCAPSDSQFTRTTPPAPPIV